MFRTPPKPSSLRDQVEPKKNTQTRRRTQWQASTNTLVNRTKAEPNTDRVMSKKKRGEKEKQSPREEFFMRENGK